MKKRKVQAKARLDKPKPIRIQVDPRQLESVIRIPEVSYEVVATCKETEVFKGQVIPLPRELPYYLKHPELMVFLVIMEETIRVGECRLNGREISIRLKMAPNTVFGAIYSLRKQGLIMEGDYHGKDSRVKTRKPNFETIQHLHDLAEGHDIGVFGRIRKAIKKKDILNITSDDLMCGYDTQVLHPDHDPREEEEYN